jgi:hypothetical protein
MATIPVGELLTEAANTDYPPWRCQMKKTTLLIIAGLVISLLSCARSERADIAIQNVTVIDGTGASAKAGRTILIAGNRIRQVGSTRSIKVGKDVRIVDGSGKFLIPGLWDMHVHPYSGKDDRWRDFMAIFIANGITSVRVMFGEPLFHRWREEISAGRLIGPRMIIASPRPPEFRSQEEGRQFVRQSKRDGADFIKILSDGLARDVYFAIADEARQQEMPFLGHVPYSISAVEASDAGQLSLEHKHAVSIPCSVREEEIRKELAQIDNLRDRTRTMAGVGYDPQRARGLFSRFVANGTFVCPTLVVWNDPAYRETAEMANDPRLVFFPSELRNWFRNMGERLIDDKVVADLRRICSGSLHLVGEMNQAGVKLLAGTDSGSVPFVLQAFSLHDELRLLVESGLSPMEALRAATANAAECAGRRETLGTIETGKIADLVLLEGHPLSSIASTMKIDSVFFNGKYFSRADLDRIRKGLKKLAAEM